MQVYWIVSNAYTNKKDLRPTTKEILLMSFGISPHRHLISLSSLSIAKYSLMINPSHPFGKDSSSIPSMAAQLEHQPNSLCTRSTL